MTCSCGHEFWCARAAPAAPAAPAALIPSRNVVLMCCDWLCSWMCKADWKTHGGSTGGYYSCNIFEDAAKRGGTGLKDKDSLALLSARERAQERERCVHSRASVNDGLLRALTSVLLLCQVQPFRRPARERAQRCPSREDDGRGGDARAL